MMPPLSPHLSPTWQRFFTEAAAPVPTAAERRPVAPPQPVYRLYGGYTVGSPVVGDGGVTLVPSASAAPPKWGAPARPLLGSMPTRGQAGRDGGAPRGAYPWLGSFPHEGAARSPHPGSSSGAEATRARPGPTPAGKMPALQNAPTPADTRLALRNAPNPAQAESASGAARGAPGMGAAPPERPRPLVDQRPLPPEPARRAIELAWLTWQLPLGMQERATTALIETLALRAQHTPLAAPETPPAYTRFGVLGEQLTPKEVSSVRQKTWEELREVIRMLEGCQSRTERNWMLAMHSIRLGQLCADLEQRGIEVFPLLCGGLADLCA